jgi:hypothetical protein
VKLTITLPDRIAKRVCRLPNPDDFVSRAVEHALDRETSQTAAPTPGESKWARLAREIADGSMSLGDGAKRFTESQQEFREGFQFKHDREE